MNSSSNFQNAPPLAPGSEVVVELSPSQSPPLLPYELQGAVPNGVWESRLRAINRRAARNSKPVLERTWLLLGLIASVAVPITTYILVLNELKKKHEHDEKDDFAYYSTARLAAIGATLGTWLVFFLPLFLWKYTGSNRIDAMLAGWNEDDKKMARNSGSVPFWSATTGLFSSGVTLTITLPSAPPSSFSPDAYLPPYIAPPAEVPSYTANKMGYQGGNFGEVPLYDNDKKEWS